MTGILQDLRVSARMLRGRPGYAAIAIVTLALGIGANVAIFSVVDAVVLRPLPFRRPDRLQMIRGTNRKDGNRDESSSFGEFRDLREHARSFRSVAAVTPLWSFSLTGGGEPEAIQGQFVSDGFFELLGTAAARGRTFTAREQQLSAPVAMISDALWRRRFGADPAIAGRVLVVDGDPVTIVGVAPPDFQFLERGDVWLPLERNPFARSARYVRLLSVVGRLRDGVSPAAAGAEIASLAARWATLYPESSAGMGARLVPLREELVGKIRPALWTLLGTVGLVLLIACANVANLVLARAAGRRREMAVRAALGAGLLRRARLQLVESVLLALGGGVGGVAIAIAGIPLMISLSPVPLPPYADVRWNLPVFSFALLLSLGTGAVFGAVPALAAGAASLRDALHDGGRGTAGASGARRLRSLLVAAEIAVAIVLLAGAGLLVRSLGRLLAVDPGFSPHGAVTFQISLPSAAYREPARRTAFAREVEARLRSFPGVTAVGRVTRLPLLTAMNNVTTFLSIEGRPAPVGGRPEIDFRRANPGYFAAMRIPLRRGRFVTDDDVARGTRAVLVNDTLARRFFPGENPVGKRIASATIHGDGEWQTVAGVVGDVRHLGLEIEPRPEIYLHVDTAPPSGPAFVVRSGGDLRALLASIRPAVASVDRDVPVTNIASLDDVVAESVSRRRVAVHLLGGFAALALLLAAIGVYGVISYSVAQRAREIGIRLALGSTSAGVVRLVLGQGMRPVAAGIAAGFAAAAVLTRFLAALLYGVTPVDPATYVSAAALLSAVALAGCYLPARRASRTDPIRALRTE